MEAEKKTRRPRSDRQSANAETDLGIGNRMTKWFSPRSKMNTQYGRITAKTWMKKECVRLELAKGYKHVVVATVVDRKTFIAIYESVPQARKEAVTAGEENAQ